jgi:hypothetical protein
MSMLELATINVTIVGSFIGKFVCWKGLTERVGKIFGIRNVSMYEDIKHCFKYIYSKWLILQAVLKTNI